MIRNKGETVRLPLERVQYIEVIDHSLFFHTSEGVAEESGFRSMKQLEAELKAEHFSRSSHGHLVNLYYVDGLRKDTVVVAGCQLPVSRSKRKSFAEDLEKYTKEVLL